MNKTVSKIYIKHSLSIIIVMCISCVSAILLPYSVSLLATVLEQLSIKTVRKIIALLTGYAIIYLCVNVLTELTDYLKRTCIQSIQRDLRQTVILKIINGEYSSMKHIRKGDYLTCLEICDEVAFKRLFSFFGVISITVTIIAASISIAKYSAVILMCVWGTCALWFFVTTIFLKRIEKAEHSVATQRKSLNRFISQVLDGKEDIVAWNRQDFISSEISSRHLSFAKKNISKALCQTFRRQFDEIVVILAIAISLLLSSRFGGSSVQGLALYMYIKVLFNAIEGVNELLQNHAIARTNEKVLKEILEIENEMQIEINQSAKMLMINRLNVSYENSTVIQNLSVKLQTGISVALWGASGSGKTTFINALIGFTKCSGEIFWGEQPVVVNGLSKLGSVVSFLPQDFCLFSGSVAENIYMQNQYVEESMDNALIKSGLSKDGFTKDSVIFQKVQENGKNLSVGQCQRICLARMIYDDKPIVILDEPTYALDDDSIDYVIKLIEEWKRTKLVIIATHDERIRKMCDKVINFENTNY